MPKTLGYFVDQPYSHFLTAPFGEYLQELDLSQKAHLLSILSGQVMQIADGEPGYTAVDSYADHSFLDEQGKVIEACEILESAPISQIKSLILALSQYIYESR